MLPRESGAYIAAKSKYVNINKTAIMDLSNKIAGEWNTIKSPQSQWKDSPFHPSLGKLENSALHAFLQRNKDKLHKELTYEEALANWVFVLDTLNFSFWPEKKTPKYTVTLDGKEYTGHFALVGSLERALREDIPIIDAKWCAEASHDEFSRIFTNECGIAIPMLDERVRSLNENGAILLQKYDGRFSNCVLQAEFSAKRLLELVVRDFKQFCDSATFEDATVTFHKRAQILISDYASALKRDDNQNQTMFSDASEFLTAFADYRVPQILHYFGVLQYTPELLAKLRSGSEMLSGCREEVELRGCMIEACEQLRDAVGQKLASTKGSHAITDNVSAASIDTYLWYMRRDIAAQVESVSPFHRVRTVYY